MSSSVNFSSGGVLARVRGLRLTVVFRTAARCGLLADFVRGASLLGFSEVRFALEGFAGLFVPFVWSDSFPGPAGVASGDIGSLARFKLFAIYFSFLSASLYARRKTAQAEIGMGEALIE